MQKILQKRTESRTLTLGMLAEKISIFGTILVDPSPTRNGRPHTDEGELMSIFPILCDLSDFG